VARRVGLKPAKQQHQHRCTAAGQGQRAAGRQAGELLQRLRVHLFDELGELDQLAAGQAGHGLGIDARFASAMPADEGDEGSRSHAGRSQQAQRPQQAVQQAHAQR